MPVETLVLKSRDGLLGSSLRVKMQAERLEDGLYRIARGEWDRTLGPVFDRAADHIRHGKRNLEPDSPVGIMEGYLALATVTDDTGQTVGTQAFHALMSRFGAAASPHQLDTFKGDARASVQRFVDEYQGGHVLASKAQLDGLTALARRAAEFARIDNKYNYIDGFWNKAVRENPAMRYGHGLLNRIGIHPPSHF